MRGQPVPNDVLHTLQKTVHVVQKSAGARVWTQRHYGGDVRVGTPMVTAGSRCARLRHSRGESP